MKENSPTTSADENVPIHNGTHLHSTNCVIETCGNMQQKSNKKDIKNYLLKNQGKKVLTISAVDDILKSFKEITFSTEDLSARLYRIAKDNQSTRLADLIDVAKNTAIYKEYEIGDALLLLKKLIKMEVFQNEECRRVIVFIKTKSGQNSQRVTYVDLIESDPELSYPGYYLRGLQDAKPEGTSFYGRFGFLFHV